MTSAARNMKILSLILLTAALALLGLVNYGRYAVNQLQLPKMLISIDNARLLLVFDKEIWALDADGHKTAARNASELDMPDGITNATATADGQLLARSLGSTTLVKIDPAQLTISARIRLDWPLAFDKQYRRSTFLATAPNGDIAVSIAEHAVLLFGADGAFKAHTPPGTYRFTNELFHSPDGWWTTDTHRSALRLLDAQSMQPIKEIALNIPGCYDRPTFMTTFSGKDIPGLTGESGRPVATVAHKEHSLKSGYVADVFADGSVIDYNVKPFERLSDLTWFNGQLLVLDNESLRIQRFDAARTQIEDFGDTALQGTLQNLRQQRESWQRLSGNHLLIAAVVLLLGGALAYACHQQLRRKAQAATATRWQIGTPEFSGTKISKAQLQLVFPVLLLIILAVTLQIAAPKIDPMLASAGKPAIWSFFALFTLIPVAILLYLIRQIRRMHNDPQYEGLLNRNGVRWLNEYGDWQRVRLPGEMPRESTVLTTGLQFRWLLITTQRILLFKNISLAERRLYKQWPRKAFTFARLKSGGRLRLQIGRDTVTGKCPSAVTAERIVTLLARTSFPAADNEAGLSSPESSPSETPASIAQQPEGKTHWHQRLPVQCAASALLPGTGQFMQNRFFTGLFVFAVGLSMLAYTLYTAWISLWAPAKAAVPDGKLLILLIYWGILAGFNVADVWRYGQKEPLAPDENGTHRF